MEYLNGNENLTIGEDYMNTQFFETMNKAKTGMKAVQADLSSQISRMRTGRPIESAPIGMMRTSGMAYGGKRSKRRRSSKRRSKRSKRSKRHRRTKRT